MMNKFVRGKRSWCILYNCNVGSTSSIQSLAKRPKKKKKTVNPVLRFHNKREFSVIKSVVDLVDRIFQYC